ncbi:MAG: hypothetical protein COA43_09935 [Robiginitomaculum sp.]|nr:MAG: hypothetical protein COA43_09935 [Robiginitomaculum sp.]
MRNANCEYEQNRARIKLKIGFLTMCIFMNVTSLAVSQVVVDAHENSSQLNIEQRQFTKQNGNLVLKAQNQMAEDNYEKAIPILETTLSSKELNNYEQGVVYQLLGSSYYEINDYDKAIHAFEMAIQSGGLRKKEASTLRINIAQLLIASDRFEQGALMLEDRHRQGGALRPSHIEMLWQAWSQAEQYDKALPWAKKWFAAAKTKERKHYDLMNFLYHTLSMTDEQADILKQMINRWPEDKTLWEAWAAVLTNGGQVQEPF